MRADIKRELLKQVGTLPSHLQFHLLDYAKKLASLKPRGISGKELLPFSGIFSTGDIKRISKIIENECERVDLNEW